MRLGKAFRESADGFEDLVAFLESAFSDTRVEFLERRGQATALPASHGAFFVAAWLAAGQEIVDVVALPELDFDFGIVGPALPARARQVALKFIQSVSFGG
jgi:hypothetical protein